MATDPAPVGLLIVRAWVEQPAETGLRAVVTATVDVGAGEEAVSHAGTVADVLEIVEAWLEALLADRLAGGSDPPSESAS